MEFDGRFPTMKFSSMKRNLLFLALMGFYASCGRGDIFDDRRDRVAEKYHAPNQQEILEGERDGSNRA